ncbi:MAG: sigma-54-dependent Fis family transcriptional regulator [Gemmatimonadales bacterium]|jgi:DNA-binding NtrC family response regulator|nr:MAG: sigma-54-dependent Fis family transcriptional regulator [Gemmatimonadales bacterium]
MSRERILVVDDDHLIRDILSERLEKKGFRVLRAASLSEARTAISRATPDLAILDVKLPDGEGTELLPELSGEEGVPCVMMTAHGTVTSAVEALRQGAEDFLEKPFSMDRLDTTLAHVLERTRLRRQLKALRDAGSQGGGIVGVSPEMEGVMGLVRRMASADQATVLLLGETGTGKGMVARALHELSPRAQGPFVNVTCSALTESLMESELFGHEKGAFTDARTTKRGLVEVAHGGTLFLDEIAELTPALQSKLLRFLEDHTFRRVGATEDRTVDVRVVAATNRNLQAEVETGRFREDLYYRLRVLPITLPPLRQRRGDVAALVAAFIAAFNKELGRAVEGVDPETQQVLEAYSWPGNVRELRNVVERAVLLSDGPILTTDLLPPEVRRGGSGGEGSLTTVELGPSGIDLEELERHLLEEALRQAHGNRTQAGRLLGLSRHQIRNRLHKYGMADS